MISPHFPPDSSAGTHRVRLLAPYLSSYGWNPTVLTVRPQYYEGSLDPELEKLVPDGLRVERAAALPVALARLAGVGDLGLRSLAGLYSSAVTILSSEKYHAIYITIYPSYPALLGPVLKRRFDIPFILDYQDPWVGSWGDTVGGGKGDNPDLRSRLTRRLATLLEPRVVAAADAITAVSPETVEAVMRRNPAARSKPSLTLPIGGDANDFVRIGSTRSRNTFFDPSDGLFHLCYIGTILPLGIETLRAVLKAAERVKVSRPDLYRRFKVHFIGTSNQRAAGASGRVMSHAEELGVGDCVSEHAPRIDYFDALAVQLEASAILLMGSSEPHYTASKLYPALLAQRPILAAYHRDSTVSEILSDVRERVNLIKYDASDPPDNHIEELAGMIIDLILADSPVTTPGRPDLDASYSAPVLARRLAELLDSVIGAVA